MTVKTFIDWNRSEHDLTLIHMRRVRNMTPTQCAEEMGFPLALIQEQCKRLGVERVKKPQYKQKLRTRLPSERKSPITIAEEWFSPKDGKKRMKIRGGAFYLDGYPLNLDGLIRTMNVERVAAGMDQVDYNERWVV